MGRNFVVTRGKVSGYGKKKRTVGRSVEIGPNALKFISLAIVAVLAIVYLGQSTAGASRGLRVGELQTTKDNLTLEEERLQAEQTRLRALQQIDTSVVNQSMEPVSSVNHVTNPAQ